MSALITPDELAEHRADAESRMGADNGSSTVTVRRKSGEMTTDARGLQVPVWADIHVDLPARLGGTAAGSAPYRTLNIGGTEVTVAARVLHLPAGTEDLVDGDHVEITAGENHGAVYRVIEAAWQDQATARRIPVVATERPRGWS